MPEKDRATFGQRRTAPGIGTSQEFSHQQSPTPGREDVDDFHSQAATTADTATTQMPATHFNRMPASHYGSRSGWAVLIPAMVTSALAGLATVAWLSSDEVNSRNPLSLALLTVTSRSLN